MHDDFVLPAILWQDLRAVLTELAAAGYAFDESWFAEHWDWHFPMLGRAAAEGVVLELRQALEPCRPLSEQGQNHGTMRLVDSSMERLEVRLIGDRSAACVVSCNGYEVPLRPLDGGEGSLGAVRYRAWTPINGLHPTIVPHTPLEFTVSEPGGRRPILGCVYHTGRPNGTGYPRLPKTAMEARRRRVERFRVLKRVHAAAPRPSPESPEFPRTLDLRCVPARPVK